QVSALAAPPRPPRAAAAGRASAGRTGAVIAPGAAAPPGDVHQDARLGDSVRLLGWAGTPPPPLRGGAVPIARPFACEPATGAAVGGGAPWRFFFPLAGPGGFFRNLDHAPVDGTMPPERWRAGQRVLDRFDVTLPPDAPAGRYEIRTGLFRGAERAV